MKLMSTFLTVLHSTQCWVHLVRGICMTLFVILAVMDGKKCLDLFIHQALPTGNPLIFVNSGSRVRFNILSLCFACKRPKFNPWPSLIPHEAPGQYVLTPKLRARNSPQAPLDMVFKATKCYSFCNCLLKQEEK